MWEFRKEVRIHFDVSLPVYRSAFFIYHHFAQGARVTIVRKCMDKFEPLADTKKWKVNSMFIFLPFRIVKYFRGELPEWSFRDDITGVSFE